jgi:hypothetical protein
MGLAQVVGVKLSSDHGRVPGDGDRRAKEISDRRVIGREFLELVPRTRAWRVALEHVGRAGVQAARIVVAVGADDHRILVDRNGDTEFVAGHRVAGRELLDLVPGLRPSGGALEHIGRAGVHAACVVVLVCTDHGNVARNGDRETEVVVVRRVFGGELLLLHDDPLPTHTPNGDERRDRHQTESSEHRKPPLRSSIGAHAEIGGEGGVRVGWRL